jgi:hypothetical protein
VASYRIYILDSDDHIVWGFNVACATDEDALKQARLNLLGAQKVEVWNERRCLGQISG